MNKLLLKLAVAGMLFLPQAMQAKTDHLLPKPQQMTVQSGTFALGRTVTITDATNSTALRNFFTSAGCTIGQGGAPVTVTLAESIAGAYDYTLHGFENEAYTLTVTADAINITAVTPTGVIRAAQTLTQLAEGYGDAAPALEAVEIKDWPAFKLRGYMHDVGRSFISVDELKKHIDLLSRFKVNCFHWHLTENQAWRMEIEAYPQLTDAQHMTRFAGSYYTQDQCREVAAYARERGVVVIPEIDMPGHSEAFTRAMGFNMQTDQGVEALKKILDEVVVVFADAPYIHIGADEQAITYTDFLKIFTDYIHNKGKKVVVWNPISGVNVASTESDMTQMWSSSGKKIADRPNIDCRYNYTNHFDVFADVVGIYKSNIYYASQGSEEIAGTISAYWNDRKTPTQEDIVKQNNMYANVLASAERAWIGGGKAYIEAGGTTLPNSGDEYDEFASWEHRFLFHKANSLKDEPIPYVKQTNVRWRITDPFPNDGNSATVFEPETQGTAAGTDLMPESFEYNGATYHSSVATGAGIYLRHTWGNNTMPTFYGNTNHSNATAYAWTYVYSPTQQTVGAQIEFQNYGRSEKDTAPDAGKWDRKGSDIWLNGERINPPTWDNSGKGINNEVDLLNENFTARNPIQVTLNQGWNKVFLKLPYVGASGVRLNKWMFTCVFTDLEGKNAVEGLIYSPSQSMDAATETLAAEVSAKKRAVAQYVGTAVGLWPESAAQSLNAKIAEIEGTYQTTKTEAEREQQIEQLEAAWTAFLASLTQENMNKPEEGKYYRMCTPLRGNRYPTAKGANQAIIGETAHNTNASIWKFVPRTDGSFDIQNYDDNTYISPASANNTALKTQTARPSAGWTLKKADTKGYVIIVSGTAQFNQTNNANLGFNVYNWGDGTNTNDTGCQYLVEEVTVEDTGGGETPKPSTIIDMTTGQFTASNPNGTWHSVWTSTGFPGMTFSVSNGNNNMQPAPENSNLIACAPGSGGCSYVITVPEGYKITGYTFGFKNSSNTTAAKTLTIDGETYTSSGDVQTVTVTGKDATSVTAFSISGNNSLITLSDFSVVVEGEATPPAPYAVPFEATTIVDGQFAAGTKWYTMQIGASHFYISDNGDADHIALTKTSSEYEAADLWCFVGNDETGYQIYNKQAGVGKVLASASTMSTLSGYGGTGGSTYPTLQAVDNLPAGTIGAWDFTSSTEIEGVENGVFMKLHGTNYAVNNFAGIGKLAFWAEGMDASSTIVVEMAESEALIDLVNGEFTTGNADNTWFKLWESTAVDGLTLSTDANNMEADDTNISIHSGQSNSSTIVITAPEGYIVSGYSFDFVHNSGDSGESITVDGHTYTVSSEVQHVAVSNLEGRMANFVQNGNNKGVTYSNFKVIIKKGIDPNAGKLVFPTAGQSVPYRIPAIAQASNGNLIAVADYRYSKADIGSGNLDLRYSISTDNGNTWGDIQTLISYTHNGGGNLHTGYGDPCIVADRESNRVMVLCCSGNVMFPSGQRNNHQGIARLYSEDNGQTWSTPYDLSDSIYAMFDNCTIGTAKSMFVGSGKISQSKTIKVGDYFRIYCALLFKDNNGTNKNYALYSDNFGDTWSVLGGINVAPIPSGADEPKAEELPDGSVLVSSRVNGGRYFNVFHYTNVETGEGEWTTSTFSGADNNGTASPGYTCNGEILVAPVVRKADNKPMYLLLQSVPFGSGRQNLGIYYKELSTMADIYSGAGVAKDWDGNYQVSFTTSCYSTMVQMTNDSIAFLYEENSVNSGYDIMYRTLSIEQITDSTYAPAPGEVEVSVNDLIAASVDDEFASLADLVGTTVGNLTEAGYESIRTIYEACKAEPTMDNYQAFQASINSAESVQLSGAIKYRLRNKMYPTKYLVINSSKMTIAVLNESNENQLVSFESNEDGSWKIYGEAVNGYVGSTGANETEITVGTSAANYLVVSNVQGESYLKCTTPTGSNSAIHAAGDQTRLVPWTTDADASRWYIEPTDVATAIDAVGAAVGQSDTFYDLTGRKVSGNPRSGLYIKSGKKYIVKPKH